MVSLGKHGIHHIYVAAESVNNKTSQREAAAEELSASKGSICDELPVH